MSKKYDKDFGEPPFPDVIVKKIEIKEITPCIIDPRRIKFIAQADQPLGDILPILYLAIPNAKYSKGTGSLSYRYKEHLVTIFSNGQIGMTYVKDRDEAEQLIEEVRDLINRAFTYLKTHGKPGVEQIQAKMGVNPMKVYNLLPRTNCGECGEQGCFAFAVKLLNGDRTLNDCPLLMREEYEANRVQIERMLNPIKLR